VGSGLYYLPFITERPGVEESGGMVRVRPSMATSLHQHGGRNHEVWGGVEEDWGENVRLTLC